MNTIQRTSPLRWLAGTIATLLVAHSANAATLYWLGTTNGNFSGNNWSNVSGGAMVSGLVPQAGDALNFDTAQTDFVDAAGSFSITNDLTLTDLTVVISDSSGTGDFGIAGLAAGIASGGIVSNVLTGTGATIGLTGPGVTLGAPAVFSSAAGSLTVASPVENGGNLLTVDGAGDTALSGAITGAGGLTKTNAGTLTLSASGSTFGGQLSVQNGALSVATINNDNASGVLGQSTLAVSLGNTGGQTGTLAYTGGTASSSKKFTMAAGGTGAFQVGTAATTLTLSGVVDGSGSLAKTGGGRVKLTGANTYSGRNVVSGGTLSILAENGLGGVPGSFQADNITIASGGTLEITSTTDTDNTGSSVALSANRGISVPSGLATIQRNHRNQNFTINGVISGAGGVIYSTLLGGDQGGGSGFFLNAANTYTGDTYLSWPSNIQKGAQINIGNSLALQNSTVYNSNILGFSENASRPTDYRLNVATVVFGGLAGGVNSGQAKALILPSVSLSIGNNNQSTTYAGTMTGGGAVIKIGTGTLTLSGASNYTGATTVAAGTLSVSSVVVSGGASNLGNATSAVVLGAATTKGTLLYTGASVTYTRGFSIAAGGGEIDVSAGRTLTLASGGISGADNSLTFGGAGNTTITTGVALGTGTLTKDGAGLLNINSGTQNYQSLVTTTGAGTTNVNVALTAPGAPSGLTDVTANGSLRFGSVSQTLNSLTIGAGATVIFTSGAASGAFSGEGGKAAGFGAAASSFGGAAGVVPEPGTLGLLLVGALGMLNLRRRQA